MFYILSGDRFLRNYKFKKNITCLDPVVCSDMMIDNLENSIGLRLKPRQQNGQHNGFLNIHHIPNDHKIDVFIYDQTDNVRFIKKPNPMPSLNRVRSNIV